MRLQRSAAAGQVHKARKGARSVQALHPSNGIGRSPLGPVGRKGQQQNSSHRAQVLPRKIRSVASPSAC